jgi:hypothetical protein
MKLTHFTFLLSIFVLSIFPSIDRVSAATLYLDPGVSTLYRGDALVLAVRLMPDQSAGECINVVDAVVTYPEHFQPIDVSIGRSIFSVWVETPTINKDDRTITFAGGIPNGYCGRVEGDPRLTNILVDLVFRSPGTIIGASSEDVAYVDFAPGTRALLNDGLGTEASLRTLGATINLDRNPGSGIVDEWRASVQDDNLPPEEFTVELVKGGAESGGRYYIVFSTIDKQTGISHYEVMEEPVTELGRFNWGAVGVPWLRATSPYLLKDQSLNSIIRVKAIDKAGNEYIATLVPDESLQSISRQTIITYTVYGLGLILILGLILLSGRYLIRRRRLTKMEVAHDEGVGVGDE